MSLPKKCGLIFYSQEILWLATKYYELIILFVGGIKTPDNNISIVVVHFESNRHNWKNVHFSLIIVVHSKMSDHNWRIGLCDFDTNYKKCPSLYIVIECYLKIKNI